MTDNDRDSFQKPVEVKSLIVKRSMQMIWVGAILIFLLTFIVYIPALKNEFINWDDPRYVYENRNIHSLNFQSLYWMLTSFHASNWHPLTWLSHTIDYVFWGLNPFGHHLTNIIIHGLNSLLVFLLVIRLILIEKKIGGISLAPRMSLSISTKALIVAGVTALLFGLHPLHVESVVWVSERKDLLCTFFVLLSLLSYLSYNSSVVKKHRWFWFNTCFLLFILALMSKPMAVTLPLILILLDIYPLRRNNLLLWKNLSVLLEKIPFVALSIASCVVTIMAQHAGGAIKSFERFSINIRLLNGLDSLVFYLKKMIVPVGLVPLYPFPINVNMLDLQYLLAIFLVLAITSFCLWMVKHGRYLFFIIWSYYVVTLFPVLGIVKIGDLAAADRYAYLPSLSIFLLIGIGTSWIFYKSVLMKHRGIFGVLIVVFVYSFVVLGQLTIKQIKIWHNAEIFWNYVISASAQHVPIAHNNLGNTYKKKGELDRAISEYKKAIELDPRYLEARMNLGIAHANKGMVDEAISELKRALTHSPNFVEAHINLGVIYGNNGKLDEAVSEFKHAIAIEPNHATAHNNIAFAYYLKGNYKLAMVHIDKAMKLGGRVNPQLLEFLRQNL